MQGTIRRCRSRALTIITVLVGCLAATPARAAEETVSGTLTVTGISQPSSVQVVSAKVSVNYSCRLTGEPDESCNGYTAYILVLPAGRACSLDTGTTWSTPEQHTEPHRSFDASWNESQTYQAPAREMRACLYAGYGPSFELDLLAEAAYTVATWPTPTPPPPPPPPDCSAGYGLSAPRARIAAGRTQSLRLTKTARSSNFAAATAMGLQLDTAGQAFFTRSFSGSDVDALGYEARRVNVRFARIGLATARLRWSGPVGCPAGEVARNVTVIRGTAGVVSAFGPTTPVRGSDAGVSFRPARNRACAETRVQPLRMTVRSAGRARRWRLDAPCGRFDHLARRLPGVLVEPRGGGGERTANLWLTATRSAGRTGRVVTVTVRSGSRRVLTQRFQAVRKQTPYRKVWQGTDEFINYCISETQELISQNLRLYCWRGGAVTRYVRRLR